MIGALFIGVFCAVGFAYVCSEYLMARLDVRRRVMVGASGLALILAVNAFSLVLMWLGATILVAASGHDLYLPVAIISVGAQAIWFVQHLWFYRRDHLRVRYEN